VNGNGESPDYHEEQREVEKDGEKVTVTVLVCNDCQTIRYAGDWMHCPHGSGKGFGEDPIEPYFDEHISESGEWITSRAQRRAIMAKGGWDYKKKRTDLIDTGKRFVFLGSK
jgi:hypothetical protein